MLEKIKIPVALQISFDDLGWHDGRDYSAIGRASRSGLPRDHTIEDYTVVNELGKALNQKILGLLCLADWDKDNILRGEVGITHDPYGWNRAAEIDMDYARACFEEMEKSEYIEYGVHTINHGRYAEDGSRLSEREIVEKNDNGDIVPISAEDLDRRLNLFFKIYNSWGFKQKLKVFGETCHTPENLTVEDLSKLNEVIYKHGLRYWRTHWTYFHDKREVLTCPVKYTSMNRRIAIAVDWDVYNVDVSKVPDVMLSGEKNLWPCLVLHWTNFLRLDPKENMEYIGGWIDYFNRQSEIFGVMISRDFEFYFNQQMYYQFAIVEEGENEIFIDLSNMPDLSDDILKREFYISLTTGTEPKACEGGLIELYESKKNFKTYKIIHNKDRIKLLV